MIKNWNKNKIGSISHFIIIAWYCEIFENRLYNKKKKKTIYCIEKIIIITKWGVIKFGNDF